MVPPIPTKLLTPNPVSAIIKAFSTTAEVVVVNGVADFVIPSTLSGWNLVRATAQVNTAGTTSATLIQVRRLRAGTPADMLSTRISIASLATVATPGIIDIANDDILTDDMVLIDIDQVSTTPPKGLTVVLEFRKP